MLAIHFYVTVHGVNMICSLFFSFKYGVNIEKEGQRKVIFFSYYCGLLKRVLFYINTFFFYKIWPELWQLHYSIVIIFHVVRILNYFCAEKVSSGVHGFYYSRNITFIYMPCSSLYYKNCTVSGIELSDTNNDKFSDLLSGFSVGSLHPTSSL